MFYKLDKPRKYQNLEYPDDDRDVYESIVCPVNEYHQHAGNRIINVTLKKGQHSEYDIIWTWYGDILIKPHVADVFKEESLTGFQLNDVYWEDGSINKEWSELVITGWGGMAAEGANIVLNYKCDACMYMQYKFKEEPEKLIDEQLWDGSDFFFIWPLPKFIFVNEKVKRILQENNFTGVRLNEERKVISMFEKGETISPGRLSNHYDEKRALEIGGPLGIF